MRICEISNTIKPGEIYDVSTRYYNKYYKVIEFVKNNCGEILDIYAKYSKYMFCGAIGKPRIYLGNSIINRTPKTTRIEIHNKLEEILKQTGFIARRTNSLFVTSYLNQAVGYGYPYIIFPFDGFKYSWCRTAQDLTVKYELDFPYETTKSEFVKDMNILSPNEFIEKYKFENNTDLFSALQRSHEILIYGAYAAIAVSEQEVLQILIPNCDYKEWSI